MLTNNQAPQPEGLSTVGSEIRRRTATYPVVTFYLLAFAISWLGFVPLLGRSMGIPLFANKLWLAGLVFPAVGPAVAAAIASSSSRFTVKQQGTPFTRLRRSFLRPVSLRWWLTTVGLSAGTPVAAAVLTHFLVPGSVPILRPASPVEILIYSSMSLAANPFEEIGWRGFAQTALEENHSALRSALIVGALWALWHIPLFLLPSGAMSMSDIPFWPWAAGVIPQAIILAWLYNRTKKSLATVSLFHFLGNVFGGLFYSSMLLSSAVRMGSALVLIGLSGVRLGQPKNSLQRSAGTP